MALPRIALPRIVLPQIALPRRPRRACEQRAARCHRRRALQEPAARHTSLLHIFTCHGRSSVPVVMLVIGMVFVMPVAIVVVALAALGVLEVAARLVLVLGDAVHARVGSRLDVPAAV